MSRQNLVVISYFYVPPYYLSILLINKTILKAYLNRAGSIGSLCASTIRITLCLAPELYAIPCSLGVYLHSRAVKRNRQ